MPDQATVPKHPRCAHHLLQSSGSADFWGASLQRSSRRCARGPGPLEVEAAEVAGDVDDFADEEQAGNFAAFHGFGGEFVGVDAAAGDFGFFVAFGACGHEAPGMHLLLEIGEVRRSSRSAACDARASGRRGELGRALRNSDRKGRERAGCSEVVEDCRQLARWGEVDCDRVRLLPVRRNLQDRGTAQAAMRDQHFLAELLSVAGGDDFGGDAR